MESNTTSGIDQIPPNQKAWRIEHRNAIHERLPDYMYVPETSEVRVGQWFPIEIGGSIRISKIPREVNAITSAFEDLGVDVEIPLVGVSETSETAMQAYKVEIQNWEPRSKLARERDEQR